MSARIRRVRSVARSESGRPNSVGLYERELDALFEEMDHDAASGVVRREFVRWPFRRESVGLTLTQQGSSSETLRLACRNLSTHGIGLLHSSYMHAGTTCRVRLRATDGQELQVPGRIVRCRHLRGMIHEIGIRFDEPIDLREVVASDPFDACFSLEQVDPEGLEGTVLHVGATELDGKIFRHFLRETRVRIRDVASAEEALAALADRPDVVIGYAQDDAPGGLDVLAGVRENGKDIPTIIIAHGHSPALREAVALAGVSACLRKPLEQTALLRALAEFLVLGRGARPSETGAGRDAPPPELVDGFVRDVRALADDLAAHRDAGELDRCEAICRRIMEAAPSLGFDRLADAAKLAAERLASSGEGSVRSAELQALIFTCRNVSAG